MDEDWLTRVRALLSRPAAEATRAPVGTPMPAPTPPTILPNTPPYVERMAQSPVADSLYRLAGAPRQVRPMPAEEQTRALGVYMPEVDAVALNPDWASWEGQQTLGRPKTPRETFAHELGHRASRQQTGDESEQAANAFMAAFDILSKTGTATPTALQAALDDAEQQMPGTRAAAERMLRSPSKLFATHPGLPPNERELSLQDIFGNAIRPR